ncbi:hypothetical protein GALL_470080 [mine drainage metagenome]|uniref:Uncharacterized protein n=1 Tax=mine drainage metagenome TaxID=410659 RepID=A0A1J5PKN4_9ZZZZ
MRHLLLHGAHHGRGCMAEHGPAVTQTEISIVLPVSIGHVSTLGTDHLQGKRC